MKKIFLLAFLVAALGLAAFPPVSVGAAPEAAPPAFTLVLKNGGMTQVGAAGTPADWGGRNGDVDVARDTAVYKSAPASLRVSVAAGKSGQGFQTVTGGASAAFKLAGWFKTSGTIKAQVFVQAFAEGYKQQQFFQIQYQQGDSDWTHFEKEVALPSWTSFFTVGILAEGDGKAWLDDIHDAAAPVDAGQPLTEEQMVTSGPPAADKPDVPGWGWYPTSPPAWYRFHQGLLDRTKQGHVNILFLGDSITEGWTSGGKDIWDKRYAPLGAADYGRGGDSTRQVLWRITHGELDGLRPKLVVLMIGTNNLYGDFNAGTDEEIAQGIQAIVQTLRTKMPASRVLLMGLLPRQNEYFSGRVARINHLIAPLDDGGDVRCLDIGDKFQTAPGKVKPELYNPDQLHPVAAGYQIWADAMQPLFDRMLQAAPRKAVSHARAALPARRPSKKSLQNARLRSAAGLTQGHGPARNAGSEHWIPMPMLSPAAAASGVRPGGEGCQYPQFLAIDSVNGSFLLYATDVGGIYRSVDGGKTFMPAETGFYAVGACGFAIDPRNNDHCLAVGDNTGSNPYYDYDGVYLSTDRGASWKQVLPKMNNGGEKAREQIAFDPSSYDQTLGYCKVAYWSEEANSQEAGGRLYKTGDGGRTWTQVAEGSAYGGGKVDSLLKIAPQGGAVYLANDSGFYKSTDGGRTFTRKHEGDFTSLDVVSARPQVVFLATPEALFLSRDGGETVTEIPHTGIEGFSRIKVSPADPRRMVCQNPKNGERYFSVDGGRAWTQSGKDFRNSWIPPEILYNDRSRQVVWSPTDPELAWGIGPGDLISKTTDHGKVFQWGNNGNNGIMTGGLINFNAQNPDVLYIGSQDYNGSLTTDGGATWNFVNLSKDNILASGRNDGDPWGWVYGGYAASPQILYGGNRAYTESAYNLWITFDGGKHTQQKYANLSGAQVSCGDPADPRVLFCWNVRSADLGQTWVPMTGCDGVFTSNARGGGELYGRHGSDLVRSRDHGVTWQVLATLPAAIRDLGYDPVHDRVFAAAEDQNLYQCDGPAYQPRNIRDRLPKDQHGDGFMTSTVAVDPVDPNVVYAGANGTGLFIRRSNGVARSLDGGETWEALTDNPKYCAGGMTGGEMASAIRVNPRTRELFVGTDCYGMWRFSAPQARTAKK